MSVPDILPNCLTKIPQIDTNCCLGGTWLKLYCANCGAGGSLVRDTELPAQYAFYLCNDCVDKYGEPAGFAKTPDDSFREKVQGAIIDEYGHDLTLLEMVKELDEPNSVVSQLEREAQRRH